mmetsp:Transcript_11026/g.18693  ORF Transcript_11026/g.18693 Transcript_11026/m.18693 type:complete len:203 (-) Transcript_11026:398-1006(-)
MVQRDSGKIRRHEFLYGLHHTPLIRDFSTPLVLLYLRWIDHFCIKPTQGHILASHTLLPACISTVTIVMTSKDTPSANLWVESRKLLLYSLIAVVTIQIHKIQTFVFNASQQCRVSRFHDIEVLGCESTDAPLVPTQRMIFRWQARRIWAECSICPNQPVFQLLVWERLDHVPRPRTRNINEEMLTETTRGNAHFHSNIKTS